MAKYFIYLMLIATTLVFSSCGDDEEIYDVDFSEVSLEEGKSCIIGDWYKMNTGCFGTTITKFK